MAIAKLLTIREVCSVLRMSRNGVLNRVARNQLRAVKVPGANPARPGRILVDEDDLAEYIERWKT